MSKSSVLQSLILWSRGAWTPFTYQTGYIPDLPSDPLAFQAKIRNTIGRLYDSSPETAAILESLAARGALRVGDSPSTGPAFWVRANSASPGVPANDEYILFDPAQRVWAISATGTLFRMSGDVVFAHELGHANGTKDPYRDSGGYSSDSSMNAGQITGLNSSGIYYYSPSSVEFENVVATQLNINGKRVSYDAATVETSTIFSELRALYQERGSLTNSAVVDIVRFGDQGGPNDNNIDFSGWASNPAILAFGFSGNDSMKGSGGSDYFYGSAGSDTLRGSAGVDRLVGGDSDDVLYGGYANDYLEGGMGADALIGGNGTDEASYFYAASGVTIDLSLRIGAADPSQVTVGLLTNGAVTEATGDKIASVEKITGSRFNDEFHGDGTGVLFVGGEGDDKFYLKPGDSADGGPGADQFHFSSTALNGREYNALSSAEKGGYALMLNIREMIWSFDGDDWDFVDGPDRRFYIGYNEIVSLDAEDQIFVDGQRIVGKSVVVDKLYNSFYGTPMEVAETNSWLSGSTFAYDGQPISGYEEYGFFEYTEEDKPEVAKSGYIELVHGEGNWYPQPDRPYASLKTVDHGIHISIGDLSSGAEGININLSYEPTLDWSSVTMERNYGAISGFASSNEWMDELPYIFLF